MSSQATLVSERTQEKTMGSLKELEILSIGGFKNKTGDVDLIKSKNLARFYFAGLPPVFNINDCFPGTEYTPLMCATWVGNKKVIDLLINHNAKAVGNNKETMSVLHIAVAKNNFELLELYCNIFKEHINHQDKNGVTALMVSAELKNPDFMRYLIDNGSDIYMKNNKGETAYDIAKNNMNQISFREVREYLLRDKIITVEKDTSLKVKKKI